MGFMNPMKLYKKESINKKILNPKLKILSSFTHPHVAPKRGLFFFCGTQNVLINDNTALFQH